MILHYCHEHHDWQHYHVNHQKNRVVHHNHYYLPRSIIIIIITGTNTVTISILTMGRRYDRCTGVGLSFGAPSKQGESVR